MHILIQKIIEGDFRRLFKGGIACNLREGLGGTIYFLLYEGTLRAFMKPGQTSHADSTDRDILIAGAAAGTFIIPVYPLDVIKTQVQSGFSSSYRESINFCMENKLMWRGLTSAVLRTVPANAAIFYVF